MFTARSTRLLTSDGLMTTSCSILWYLGQVDDTYLRVGDAFQLDQPNWKIRGERSPGIIETSAGKGL